MIDLTLFKSKLYATFTLAGTIIGVGFLALPLLTYKVGILTMTAYLALLGYLVYVLHSMYAQIVAVADPQPRLPGYVEKYLGKKVWYLAILVNVTGLLGALLAYMLVGGRFLNNLLGPLNLNQEFTGIFLFFAAGALLIFLGLRSIAKVEIVAFLLFVLILWLVAQNGQPFWQISNLFGQQVQGLLPYGVLFFSFWGMAAIPEVSNFFQNQAKSIRRALINSTWLVALFYFAFCVIITGITGALTSADAFSAFPYFFNDVLIKAAFALGFLACFTSFLTIGLNLVRVLNLDFKLKPRLAWLAAMAAPLLLYLLGLTNFLAIISFLGGVLLGLEGLLVIMVFRKLPTKAVGLINAPALLQFVIAVALILGIVYELNVFLGWNLF